MVVVVSAGIAWVWLMVEWACTELDQAGRSGVDPGPQEAAVWVWAAPAWAAVVCVAGSQAVWMAWAGSQAVVAVEA